MYGYTLVGTVLHVAGFLLITTLLYRPPPLETDFTLLVRLGRKQATRPSLWLFASSILLACTSDGPTPPTSDLQLPTVRATVEFGDAPLSGSLLLLNRSLDNRWTYEVEFEDDTAIDAQGTLSTQSAVSIPFSFTTPGIYPVSISFAHQDTTIGLTRYIVVNDPEAFGATRRVQVPRANPNSGFEGIAVNADLNRIYVGDAMHRTVLMLSLDSTELLAVADNLGPGSTLEGFAISEDEQVLYVIDKSHSLHIFDGLTLERIHHNPQFAAVTFFIEVTAQGTLWASVPGLVSYHNGEIRNVLDHSTGIWHFDVLGENERIVFINRLPLVDQAVSSGGIGVIAEDGTLQWHTPVDLETFFIPQVVAFSPNGQSVYVLGYTRSRTWKFILLSGIDGSLQYEMNLDDCSTFCTAGAANPVAYTADGRFVVIPTDGGTYFIDTLINLPRFRAPLIPSDTCCNVASIPGTTELLFVTTELLFLEFHPE